MTDLPPSPPPTAEPRPRRPWVRRSLIAFLVVANIGIFGGLAALWLGARQVTASVTTLDAGDLDLTEKPVELDDPRTFLLIGSDSRADLPEDFGNFGSFGGQRADVIMLLQVFPGEGRIQLLSLPRDLKVTWNGSTSKINGIFNEGPAEIVTAVRAFAGVPIHHYLQVDFAGFAGIVDAVGGIEMTFPHAARDLKSKLDVSAGRQVIDGKTALALARSRSYQELVDGQWVYVDATDFGRTRRQQDLLLAMITQIDRPSSIGGFRDLLDALGDFVTIDGALDEDSIIQLAWEMRSISAEDFDTRTLPSQISNEDGVSYVVPVQPDADQVLAAFRAGEPLDEIPSDVRIEVQNGGIVAGAAAQVAAALTGAGYDVVRAINSDRGDYQTTLVIARPTRLPAAERVVESLGYGAVVVGQTPEDVDVVVIVGSDAGLD
jgi:LCP family protein required for cell wall assembly